MGSVYQRGKVYWIKYHQHGKAIFESSKSTKVSDAKRLLSLREGQIVEGKLPDPKFEKTMLTDLAEPYIDDYEINGNRTLKDAKRNVKTVKKFLGRFRAIEITPDRIQSFISKRKQEGKSNASVNRELASIRRMFTLGIKQGLINAAPYIPRLEENNKRTGFYSHDEFLTLRGKAPDHLKVAITLAYWTGMRQGEILSLRWNQIDWDGGFLRLDPDQAKTKDGRVIPFIGDMMVVLEVWKKKTLKRYPKSQRVVHFRGRKIKSIKTAWSALCEKAGLQGKLFHDFRRTGVRNLVRAGVSKHIAKQISGHKTDSVFDRYDIVEESDLKNAAEKVTNLVTLASKREIDQNTTH